MKHPLLSESSEVQIPLKLKIDPGSLVELGRFFAKTDNAVFSTRGLLKDVSPQGFELLVECEEQKWYDDTHFVAYARNASCAYFCSTYEPPKTLASKSPASLSHIDGRYASDGTLVFYAGNKLEKSDPNTFEVISWCYARDAYACYHFNKKIDGADPGTFRLVCTGIEDSTRYFSADAHSAFYYDRMIPGAVGADVRAVRGEGGRVLGVTDGRRTWTSEELAVMMQRPRRAVHFPDTVSNLSFHEELFNGLEERLAMFLLLCSKGSIEDFERFTRGRIGENSLIRTIGFLNERVPAAVAEVAPGEIRITPVGMAIYKQFGKPIESITTFLENTFGR